MRGRRHGQRDDHRGALSAPRLLSLVPLPEAAVRGLLGELLPRVELVLLPQRDGPSLQAALADVDLVLASWQGTSPLPFDTAAVEAAGPRLAFVQQPSVGVDSIDVAALAARGVPVSNAAGANAGSVAEWCLGAALAVSRSLLWADAEVRAGRWPQVEVAQHGSLEIGGRRVGLLGFGAIGQRCAQAFGGLGASVRYSTRTRRPAELEHGAVWGELEEVLAASDVLVVTLPRADGTAGLLDADRLALLPRGAVVVSAGRGGVVDEAALLQAVRSGALVGAALDVYDTEPLPAGDPLRGEERILLSPHAAGSSVQGQLQILTASVTNLRRILDGEPINNVVNGVDPLVRLRA